MQSIGKNSPQAFRKVSHVIFDMDGVILDTEPMYTLAINNVVAPYGKSFTWREKLEVMGLVGFDSARKIVELLELPITVEDYYEKALKEYEIVMQNVPLMPDTEVVYKAAISKIASAFGKTYTPRIQAAVVGTVERESARIAIEQMQLPMSIDNFLQQFRKNANDQFKVNVTLVSGAERLVKHLHCHKIPIAVATSSSEASYEMKSKPHKELFSLFNHIVFGGSDPKVKAGKPAPDVFLEAARRFADCPDPSKCLVFEDAPNGVKAAVNAGMQVIMIPDAQVPVDLQKEATIVIKSLEQVPLESFGLPPLK